MAVNQAAPVRVPAMAMYMLSRSPRTWAEESILMHFIGELSAEEADALAEAYRRLTGRNPESPR
jgi:hypothetical protein